MEVQTLQDQLLPESVFRFYIRRDLDLEQGPKVRRLWLAVLQRALQDYVTVMQDGAVDEELDVWFNDPSDAFGSYRSICHILDIDGDRLLEHLPNISDEGLRGLRKSGLGDVY